MSAVLKLPTKSHANVQRSIVCSPQPWRLCLVLCIAAMGGTTGARADESWRAVSEFVESRCLDCHDGEEAEAGLDLRSIGFDLSRRDVFDRWILIHDRVRDGEMPPPDDGVPRPLVPVGWSTRPRSGQTQGPGESRRMLRSLARLLSEHDRRRIDSTGRAKLRRLNRFEYENKLRQVLDAPWLQVADMLPEDGVEHLFNKSGERLDVSHVQLTRYMQTAERAVRLAVNAAAHQSETRKFHAREEPAHQNYVHYRFGQKAATRSIVPLVGLASEPEVIRMRQPMSVGAGDPDKREREAMGVFSGVYSATTKYDFTRINAPADGLYRLRFKTYTFVAGPNGASGGDDHGLTGGNRAWWRPDRNVIRAGERSEPVTLYALAPSGDSRWLTTFDSHPEPTVFECVASLRQGEGIRPDAARLVRTRPGWSGNPNATEEGVPGFAMNWLEVEGPLSDSWPPRSYQAVFGDLPFEIGDDGRVEVVSVRPEVDARRVLENLVTSTGTDVDVQPFLRVYDRAVELEQTFTDAAIAAASAVLCSPDFLYLEALPGPLDDPALRQRLAYFLWNGPPDTASGGATPTDQRPVREDTVELRNLVERMLEDPRSDRFVAAFLDYWLDLRDVNANTPDAALYPDYYLDELLTESSVLETRLFFRELIDKNLPVRNLVDSDFAFVNERLAEHYDVPGVEGVGLRRVKLPDDSPRGGLLTQASVLRVTANGTTTSPVVRGAWVMERILGTDIPAPPSGVDAVEPDTRGAKTIRQQLDNHRANPTCNACHARFDPAGLGLESFDVAGGWRGRYRALGDFGEPVDGIGKNGHRFEFRLAQPVDCTGTLLGGASFRDVRDLKQLLAKDERRLARNLLHRFVVYATGAPVSFADRADVESILDQAAKNEYGVRSLIHALVQSELFQIK